MGVSWRGWRWHSFIAVLLVGFAGGADAASRDSDTMVLRNGDLHVGRVAQESFTMETAYGVVDVPLSHVAGLRFARSRQAGGDELLSVEGERLTGRLVQEELFVIRGVFGPSLFVDTADIAHIEFAPFPIHPRLWGGPDVVVFANGDRLRGRTVSGDFMIKGKQGLGLLGRGRLRFLDIDSSDEGRGVIVQARLRDRENPEVGTWLNPSVVFQVQYGPVLDLKANQIDSLAFDVLPGDAVKGVRIAPSLARGTLAREIIRDRFTDERHGPEMAVLRPVPFRLGDLQGDGDGDEKPSLTITLPRPFAIGIHPVTFAAYDRYCQLTGCLPPDDQGWGRGERPVINVSWLEAAEYAVWLSAETGKTYRLPTDAEWEFAARAGTGSRFWWGNDPGVARANCATCGSAWDGEKTAPVGRFPANPFGLHDMAGNVWEWTADCYHDTLQGAPADGRVRDKPGCGKRVIRGGAWSFPPKEMRSANRWRDFPSRRSDDTGFRLVREMEP